MCLFTNNVASGGRAGGWVSGVYTKLYTTFILRQCSEKYVSKILIIEANEILQGRLDLGQNKLKEIK